MSGSNKKYDSTGSFFGLWLLIFIIIKVGGTSLASWSWFWVFLPCVPVIVLTLQKLGLL